MARRVLNIPGDEMETATQQRKCSGEIAAALNAAGVSANTVVNLALPSGERLQIPKALVQVLRDAAEAMARGAEHVHVVPEEQELTTRQAAGLLGVSRPYLIQLLDQADIPYRRVGTRRRIPLEGLLAYKRNQEAHAADAFQEMVDLTEEADLYTTREYGESARD